MYMRRGKKENVITGMGKMEVKWWKAEKYMENTGNVFRHSGARRNVWMA